MAWIINLETWVILWMFPQGMVPWISVEDNLGPPWRKTMRLGWSRYWHPGIRLMVRGVCFSVGWAWFYFFRRWLERCVWWKFFVQFFFFKETSARNWQEPANAEINAVNQHKKPKEALLFDKLLPNFCGFCLDVLSKSLALNGICMYVTNVLFGSPDLRTWLSLLVTLTVAAIKIQSKNSRRPWPFQISTAVGGDACCRHVSMWVM